MAGTYCDGDRMFRVHLHGFRGQFDRRQMEGCAYFHNCIAVIKRRQQTGRAGIGCQEEITSVILLDDFDNISDPEWVYMSINTDWSRFWIVLLFPRVGCSNLLLFGGFVHFSSIEKFFLETRNRMIRCSLFDYALAGHFFIEWSGERKEETLIQIWLVLSLAIASRRRISRISWKTGR